MASVTKRKHTTLSLDLKMEMLKKLDKGEKICDLAKFYGVGRATIHDIRQNRKKIEDFFNISCAGPSKRQTLKAPEYPKVEEALYTWFLQERARHTPISGEMLCQKAKFFYNKLHDKDDFRASDGWLDNFKKRHGIRLLTITGEKLSSDVGAVDPFVKKFQEKIKELGLVPDQVYNADESGLFWKLLPQKTFVHSSEKSAPGRKLFKNRITFMPCANANGTHKLDLLTVGKAKNPRAFKNVNLPVVYKNQPKSWVTREVFRDWFNECFVPEVRKFLRRRNLPPKALLVLDNAPGHPNQENLKSKDGLIQIMFLPPNCTPLLQPMDQNVIQVVKSRYKKKLLIHVASQENDIVATLKEINLKHVVFMLAESWKTVSSSVIVSSWKKLWPSLTIAGDENQDVISYEWEADDLIPLADLVHAIAQKDVQLTNNDLDDWLSSMDNEPVLSDEAIVEKIQFEEMSEDENQDVSAVPTIKSDEALSSFNKCIKWAEENMVSVDDVMVLRKLREYSFKQSFAAKKQTKITDYMLTE